MPDNAKTTLPIGSNDSKELESAGSKKIQPVASAQQSLNIKGEIDHSIRLCNSTMNDLHSSMQALKPTDDTYPQHRVQQVVNISKSINELMKTKLEAVRMAKILENQ